MTDENDTSADAVETPSLNTPLRDLIQQAQAARACEDGLRDLRELGPVKVKDGLNHPKAPYWIYFYARCVIKRRWPEAESVIASDPKWAHYYALNVIKRRWPEAESVIASDPKWAYLYALYVIKGRWPEAESVIASDPKWAHYYALNVISIKGKT